MKIEVIKIDESEIKVRKAHKDNVKKWYDRLEESKVEYKRKKSNNKWWENELDDNS